MMEIFETGRSIYTELRDKHTEVFDIKIALEEVSDEYSKAYGVLVDKKIELEREISVLMNRTYDIRSDNNNGF